MRHHTVNKNSIHSCNYLSINDKMAIKFSSKRDKSSTNPASTAVPKDFKFFIDDYEKFSKNVTLNKICELCNINSRLNKNRCRSRQDFVKSCSHFGPRQIDTPQTLVLTEGCQCHSKDNLHCQKKYCQYLFLEVIH